MNAIIKAIETNYKGYRFRSRLEARWAVFFETLGVEWKYEVEGFEFNGTRYLPDFFLPKSNTCVEVKPYPIYEHEKSLLAPTKIYMAGKIKRDCWRHGLVSGLKNTEPPEVSGSLAVTRHGHLYCGPFFVAADHSNPHGANSHGATVPEWASGWPKELFKDKPHMFDNQQIVFEKCLDWIRSSDEILCWIDSVDCYGTLFELGYASSLGKKISIGLSETLSESQVNDLWFARASGRWSHRSKVDSPTKFFDEVFTRSLPGSEKAISISAGSDQSFLLIHGDPYFDSYNASVIKQGVVCQRGYAINSLRQDGRLILGDSHPDRRVSEAYQAARSARFEHGETP